MRLIDADRLSEDINQAQDSLMTNDDKMWDINKPYFKGLAWVRGLINDAPTVNPYEWISVKDRLPEKDEYAWCYSDRYGGYRFIGYRGYISGEFMEGGSLHIGKVTHWMPLPPPPHTEEGQP